MIVRDSPTGMPYLARPDDGAKKPEPAVLLGRIFLFMLIFSVLEGLWNQATDTLLERVVVDHATVSVAAIGVRLLTPAVDVAAVGPSLTATGGGINVLKGCEGTEVVFLLIAAFAVAGLSWRQAVAGMVLGTGLTYAMNLARILALFYAYRHDPVLFSQLHGIVAPILMVLLVGLFFFFWLRLCDQKNAKINGIPAR